MKRFADDQVMAATISGGETRTKWVLANEVPIGFVYNKINYAVMMATASDLRDFAIGFSLAEGILHRADELLGLQVRELEHGIELHVEIPDNRVQKLEMHQQRRAHRGRAGCGICGVDNLADALRPLPRLSFVQAKIETIAILKAIKELPNKQPMRTNNHTVHGAAWVDLQGELLVVREDIGRHNALDKMIGAKISISQPGFALLSSRCTYELVQKCAMAGIGTLVCLAAPTISAVETASKANIDLRIYDRRNGEILQFNSPV